VSAVFSHGRLRLYLLKLLEEGPKHGYELIRLLENRFYGLYAPSAGTIYPRLARMEGDGLITHTAAGGRKTYEITQAGRDELVRRADELAELEREIHASVADLAALAEDIEENVRGSVRDLKRELRTASDAATPRRQEWRQMRDEWRGRPRPAATDQPGYGSERGGRLAARSVVWSRSVAPLRGRTGGRLGARLVRDQLQHPPRLSFAAGFGCAPRSPGRAGWVVHRKLSGNPQPGPSGEGQDVRHGNAVRLGPIRGDHVGR
jgi:DNA-binding PadR family transcriptional regulator